MQGHFMPAQYMPDGYHNVTPYLTVTGLRRFIDFLKEVFDAKERYLHAMPNGAIMHAEFQIGDSKLMLGEMPPGMPTITSSVYVYVQDVDAVYKKAIGAGAASLMEP